MALERDEGAEDDEGLAGKTNGGFGGGGFDRGDACALERDVCGDAMSPKFEVSGNCIAAPCSRQSGEGGSIIMSGPIVAMFRSRSAAPEPIGNSVQHGRHGKIERRSRLA